MRTMTLPMMGSIMACVVSVVNSSTSGGAVSAGA